VVLNCNQTFAAVQHSQAVDGIIHMQRVL